MSGHVRFGFAAFFFVAALASPVAANPFTDLFSSTPAAAAATPAAPADPAPAAEGCLSRPGAPVAGRHWMYRYDGGRRCWYPAAEDSAPANRVARHHAATRHAVSPERHAAAPRMDEAVEDAHDELPTPAPAATPKATSEVTPKPTAAEPKLTVLHTVPVQVADAAAPVPPPPVPAAGPAAAQPAPPQPAPPQVDVEKLLADGPAASDQLASAPAAAPIAAPAATPGGGGQEKGMASWLGVLLIALGGAALLSSSRSLRRRLGSLRFPGAGAELAVAAHGGESDLAFAPERAASARPRRDELLRYEPKSTAPLARAARTRPPAAPVAPEPSSEEALWHEGIGALAALAGPVAPEGFGGRRKG